MSKPVKNLIIESYRTRFDDVEGGVVIGFSGMPSDVTMSFRATLAKERMRLTVVKNGLFNAAVRETRLERFKDVLVGPSAIVYGKVKDDVNPVKVARRLIEIAKEIKGYELEFKGAVMDGEVFSAAEVEKLSKYPTRVEALGTVVSVILGAAGQLVSSITSPGGQIASILDTIKEKLEKGETIAKLA